MDVAAAQRVRDPNGFAAVEKELLDSGLEHNVNNQAWGLIQKYSQIFNRFLHQNLLILLRSHWDWYINKLGLFTVHGRNECGGPSLSNTEQKELERLGFAPIRKQIEVLERSTGVKFSLADDILDNAEEMALVRNLGIHNRWEVNDFYKSKTKTSQEWTAGDIRVFTALELEAWNESLVRLTHETCFPIAKLYCAASDFPT